MTAGEPTGDDLVVMLAALANPLRLRIVARLAGGRDYVSHLAREIGVSRPLLHLHLQRLEAAGLVVGRLELSEDGKAMKYFELADLDSHLDPATIVAAVQTLSPTSSSTSAGWPWVPSSRASSSPASTSFAS